MRGLWGKLWPKPSPEEQAPRNSDSVREIVETIVFVVVLVLLLKSFAAEAFVIPTGSMAVTLYGYQKDVTCPKCGHEYPVNCSREADPQDGQPVRVDSTTCENCNYHISNFRKENPPMDLLRFRRPRARGEVSLRRACRRTGQHLERAGQPAGHRRRRGRGRHAHEQPGSLPPPLPRQHEVPGAAALSCPAGGRRGGGSARRLFRVRLDPRVGDGHSQRDDVVVFKYPDEPQKNYTPMNYIKRLIGLPGETIAIY